MSEHASDLVAQFQRRYSFGLDDFQLEACQQIAADQGVLVAAPTGSGKTVVGEFACWLAMQTGRKAFYTTPIKALSNQKYHDLVDQYGADSVGLLTGDLSINSEARIVVMTTEVLRNMIYAGSSTLSGLGYVVLDEVHYLADKFRGAVWEEVILGLSASVQLVCLSATVSNAEEFGAWLDQVRDGVQVILSEKRPVPLYQHVIVGRQIMDLFVDQGGRRQVNPELTRLSKEESKLVRDDARRTRSGRLRARIANNRRNRGDSQELKARLPRRDGTVETLAKLGLLPAICFVFSRQGCDQAVGQLLNSQLDLTSKAEKRELAEIAAKHAQALSLEDLRALDWDNFEHALLRGIAAHHAGLLPVLKAIVEEGFTKGLIKVVYATETLALGINMPAKTVVIEKTTKFNGESHAELTPGEYTQLTGRAGRRGIDDQGHAVVFWRTGLDPNQLAGLASTRTYPLRSSFSPNYNMAVNLVGTVGRERARALLEQSFAQYQADKSVVKLAKEAKNNQAEIDQLWAQAACERGDFASYALLRHEIGVLEDQAQKLRKKDQAELIRDSINQLSPGDIVFVPAGKHQGWAAVIMPKRVAGWPLVMSHTNQIVQLSQNDLNQPLIAQAKVRLAKHFDQHSVTDRRSLARSLQARIQNLGEPAIWRMMHSADKLGEEIAMKRQLLRDHPCHACPDRETHARFAEQALRLQGSKALLKARANRRANSMAAKFDRVCQVLDSLGYLSGDQLTDSGRLLARIYNDHDLMISEALQRGLFNELTSAQLAAVLSTLVYEPRMREGAPPTKLPDLACEHIMTALRGIWREIGLVERDNRVDRMAEPQIGFAPLAYDWADGATLADIMGQYLISAGDFVRWIRQIIDLANQIAKAPGCPITSQARTLVQLLRRDIVDFDADEY